MSPVPEDDKNREDPKRPDDITDNVEMPHYSINVGTSSDSEEDDAPQDGYYQLLPQDPEGQAHPGGPLSDDEESDDASTPTIETNPLPGNAVNPSSASGVDDRNNPAADCTPTYMQVPPCKPGETVDRLELWNSEQENSMKIDEDQADKIKEALSGFSLPPPPWARLVPEQQWKTRLITKIHGAPIQQTNPWQKPCDTKATNAKQDPAETQSSQSGEDSWATFPSSESGDT